MLLRDQAAAGSGLPRKSGGRQVPVQVEVSMVGRYDLANLLSDRVNRETCFIILGFITAP
jgi:hypothetical protein